MITEDIRGTAVDALSQKFDVVRLPNLWKDSKELARQINDFRGLIVRNQTTVDSVLLDAAQNLIVVGRAGVGLDNVDVEHATRRGVLVTSTPDQNAISVAELAICLMVSLARKVPDANQDTRAGNWNRQKFLGTELYGKTLGIIGAGKIGYLTAQRARALGMKIVAYDPFISRDNVLLGELQADLVSLDELLSLADVVSCHLPATKETVGLLDLSRFRKMKPTSFLVNTSRGEIVREEDLLHALKSSVIAGAALDVRASEPPIAGPLEGLPNLILTPHIAALTREAQDRVTRAVCDDVARVLEGRAVQNAVNKPLNSAVPAPRESDSPPTVLA
ncbi:hydroxyacid dehydrogenase [Edaphobacter bradus]|uniref:hydroxyacid dehydrogenase n=1 Tax=Edaphobacter bradus TaxID=2259016 RepID=UPI0021DFDAD1|nr:hydroxyacid dehydrogenase [Edaphobacter bradus]